MDNYKGNPKYDNTQYTNYGSDNITPPYDPKQPKQATDRDTKEPLQLLIEDFDAFSKIPYRKIRSVTEIEALIAIGDVLLIRLSACRPPLFATRRPIMIMRKSIHSRLIQMKQLRAKLLRINELKVRSVQQMRMDAMNYRAQTESGVMPALLEQNKRLRSSKLSVDMQRASETRQAMSKPVIADLIKYGFPINGTPEEIAAWRKQQEALQNQTGTNAEYESIIERMNALENERIASTDCPPESKLQINSENDSDSSENDSSDKIVKPIGEAASDISPEEWSKLL
jgi:hypothetical protein